MEKTLKWTGERYIPDIDPNICGVEIHYEHLHRYAFASQFVKGKNVLDLASGEGYGSHILAHGAKSVVGVEIDDETVRHARNKYQEPNLEFIQGSILDIPLEGQKLFDVVVCFEAIEHIIEQDKLLSGVRRLLKDDGLLIISTPNKEKYSDENDYNNPYHLKELYFDEFQELLAKFFPKASFFGQKVFVSSYIWQTSNMIAEPRYSEFIIERPDGNVRFKSKEEKIPKYIIAIASNIDLDSIKNKDSFFIDISDIMFNYAIGNATSISNDLSEKERKISALNQSVACLNDKISALDGEIKGLKENNAVLELNIGTMKKSTVWRMLMALDKIVDVTMPRGSRRRSLYGSLLTKLQNPTSSSKNTKNNDKNNLIRKYSGKNDTVDIICFPIINWDFRYQRPQQLLSRFAKNGHRVFYLTVDLNQSNDNYAVKEIDHNILEIRPSISGNFNIYKDTLNEGYLRSLMDSISVIKKDFNIDNAACFIEFPGWQPLVFKLRDTYGWKIIFDCLDEYAGFSNVKKEIVEEENALRSNSDFVVTTSLYLLNKSRERNDRVTLIPNAGDYDHFNAISPNDSLKGIKKPIIGYYGAISDWFDNDLIAYLANKRKDWSFVLIGHTDGSNISNLSSLSNVHFLGEKPYAELPGYLYWFDVCLIPFKITPLIEATHPVKFYEYLSSGKPVVSTRLPELSPYSDLCYIANNNEEFLSLIEIALKDGPEIRQRRMDFAKNNTWEDRYKALVRQMEITLK